MVRAPERSRAALDDLVATGRSALGDVRRILGVLHEDADEDEDEDEDEGAGGPAGGAPATGGAPGTPRQAPVEPQPGSVDLHALVERFRRAGLPVRTAGVAGEDLRELDASLGLTVYRIVQESLTNALRHAPGTAAVLVEVRVGPERVEVVTTDAGTGTGPGAQPGPGSQRGLVGMRERTAAFGGTLEAGPHGPGWRVRAVLPRPGAGS